MKRAMVTLFLLFVSLAAEVDWQPDYATARAKALKEKKPMMVLLVSHTCRWCRKLENRTLEHPEVSHYVNTHFVPVLVYREDNDRPDFIRSSMVPTTFLLTPEGKNLIKPVVGYWEPMEYMTDLKMAVKKFRAR